ncbi:hypothetical protein V6B95_09600 [Thermoanaerobacterium saccharolyticum]|uniref:Uncharacterized protein n=1 Tax=Thermoanaerobacterium thermosaccharolyticum M0795 TaxID=698948 RepID=L0IGC9_THETR|nr:hypothetical protein [Thermoanaerobacterium thermosaccharolyticum]AGB17888.1 hypothetical protein Thethe_00151 [Thermoanaerobacterium thermosaccharolyticum M0795]MDI3477941.1 hypothetical protein [Thermoanaerobacterium sp.]MDK2828779.1 hypothetical protein [Clostridium butyricum]
MNIELYKVHKMNDFFFNYIDNLYANNNLIVPIYEEVIPRYIKKYASSEYKYCFKDVDFYNTIEYDMNYIEALVCKYNNSCDSFDIICYYSSRIGECIEELLESFLFAKYTNRRFIYAFNKAKLFQTLIDNRVKSALIILPLDEFNIIERFLLRLENEYINIGYLPYYDKYTINFFMLKYLMYINNNQSNNSIIINRVDQDNDITYSNLQNCYYFSRKLCTKDMILNIMNGQNELLEFNYLSHCRECVLRFNDFIFCGAYNIIEKHKDSNKHLPCCYYNADDCYITNVEKYNVSELNAHFYFLSGCNIGDFNQSIVPFNYTVVSNLIENNAISIITSASIKTGNIAENILAHNLLNNGYTAGQIEFQVNKFLEYSKIETNNYFLLGDPLFRKLPNSFEPKYKHKKILRNGTIIVEFNSIQDETYLEISIEELYKNLYVNEISFDKRFYDIKNNIYYYFSKNSKDESQKLIMFSLEKFSVDSISILISNNDTVKNQINEMLKYLDKVIFLRDHFKLENLLKGKIIDIENNLKKILSSKNYNFSVKEFINTNNVIYKLRIKFMQIFKDIFNMITDYTLKYQNNFYENITDKRTSICKITYDNTCSNCHNITLMTKYSIKTTRKTYVRTSIKCYKCGIIQDVPNFKMGIRGYTNLKFDINGNNINVLELRNYSNEKLKLFISAICIDSKDVFLQIEDNEIEIDPNESHIVKLFVKPTANLKKHYYLTVFYIMVDGDFYFVSNTLSYI